MFDCHAEAVDARPVFVEAREARGGRAKGVLSAEGITKPWAEVVTRVFTDIFFYPLFEGKAAKQGQGRPSALNLLRFQFPRHLKLKRSALHTTHIRIIAVNIVYYQVWTAKLLTTVLRRLQGKQLRLRLDFRNDAQTHAVRPVRDGPPSRGVLSDYSVERQPARSRGGSCGISFFIERLPTRTRPRSGQCTVHRLPHSCRIIRRSSDPDPGIPC